VEPVAGASPPESDQPVGTFNAGSCPRSSAPTETVKSGVVRAKPNRELASTPTGAANSASPEIPVHHRQGRCNRRRSGAGPPRRSQPTGLPRGRIESDYGLPVATREDPNHHAGAGVHYVRGKPPVIQSQVELIGETNRPFVKIMALAVTYCRRPLVAEAQWPGRQWPTRIRWSPGDSLI
jgi:hypothetical protein